MDVLLTLALALRSFNGLSRGAVGISSIARSLVTSLRHVGPADRGHMRPMLTMCMPCGAMQHYSELAWRADTYFGASLSSST